MKHIYSSIVFIALFLTACSQHPTLDDFFIEDEIILDAEDLLNDDPNKGVEIEKDNTGSIVASANPPELITAEQMRPHQVVTLPGDAAQKKESKKKEKAATAKKKQKKIFVPFQSRLKDLTFINEASSKPVFDPNALGDHLLGKPVGDATTVSPEVDAYRQSIMEMKLSYEDRNLSKMRKWRDQELITVPRQHETLFYPFSGPDVVNMLTFFPNQQTYVMMGMEYVGTIDTVADWMKPLTQSRMDTIRKAVESVFIRSFFRTLDMSSDFSRNGTRGVLPGMLLMLKLMDRNIKSVQWVALNEDGSLRYLTAEETKVNCDNFGVQVTIAHPTQGYDQTIYYFKTDLTNKPMAENKGLRSFITKRLGTTMTFVKSASFLMHMKEFIWMRDAVLDISRCVLQDDSGVPFKFYIPSKWRYSLFGEYVGPYGESFAAFKQPELNKAYDSQPLQLLEFNFGYGYAKIPSHLMLFKRIEN
ncbi:MAG: hypothetical protein H6492_00770 [Candidatus Paracaedibacteraceae bacterium]|nr:hypothetical protein [Candidatus Paracaedibacteraceae bacterium]